MPRILVADDNTNIQKMVALAFQERGIDVVSVGNGEAAVRRLPDLNPDLILADIFMPVRNGYELCEWVKKDTKFSQTPVILLVGAFDPLDEKEARRVGADGILKKPFIPPDPLIAMVTLVLERNPKIAAELARAKEKKAEKETAVSPEPLAASETIEIPVRAASKPLPKFPDPSPEEESLIYAFGTGRRVLDDGAGSPDEPPAPKAEEGQETEDEFDSASTTSDWRRSAMQFEVPEEAAMRPAIPSEEYLEATFPSEHAAPAEEAHVSNSAEESEPAAQDKPLAEFPAPWPLTAAAEPELHEVPAVEEATPEPSFASQATHWMDMMASAPGRPAGDWFSSVSPAEPAERSVSIQAPDGPAFELPQAPVQAAEQPSAETASEPETPEISVPFEPEPAAATSDREESFFADEPELSAASSGALDQAGEVVHAEAGEEQAPEPASFSPAPDREIVAEPSGETSLYKDANLIEPPAVRVVPEPMLVDESPQSGPPSYDSHWESVASAHSFTASPPEERVDQVQGEAAEEAEAWADSKRALLESSTAESSERVPTIPPPNREALADIPFLNPPRHFSEDTDALNDAGQGAAGSATVDAIVERILARIEPHLHDLLSQGVKPLVENLLQSELEKHKK